MPRSEPVHPRHAREPARERDVIDAQFRLVGRERRALGVAWKALLAVLLAALIGLMLTPVWSFVATIGAYFARG